MSFLLQNDKILNQWDNFNFIDKISKLTQDFKQLCIEKYNWNIVVNTMLPMRKSMNTIVPMGNLGILNEYYCSYGEFVNTIVRMSPKFLSLLLLLVYPLSSS